MNFYGDNTARNAAIDADLLAHYGPDDAADTAARAYIADAEQLGFIREPSTPDGYACHLYADAIEADLFLRFAFGPDDAEALADELATNDPDQCGECGKLDLCDCRVYVIDNSNEPAYHWNGRLDQ